jgi:hypothetical protein
MKPPGTDAGSGSISRLGPQFANRPPRIPHPTPSHVSNAQNSNRESLRLETVVTQRKERMQTISNREKEACFLPSNARQIAFRTDRSPQNPHRLRNKTARKTNSRPPTLVSGRKKSALYFVQLTRILSEPMFRVEQIAKRRKIKARAEFGASSRGVGLPRPRVGGGFWLGVEAEKSTATAAPENPAPQRAGGEPPPLRSAADQRAHPRRRKGDNRTQLASNKTIETNKRSKRINSPSIFVSVRKISGRLCISHRMG